MLKENRCEPTYKELKLRWPIVVIQEKKIRCEPTYKELKLLRELEPVEDPFVLRAYL